MLVASLRDPPAQPHSLCHPRNRQQISCNTVIYLVFFGRGVHLMEGAGHFGVKALVYHIFWPVITVRVLYHLKIRNGYAAGITEEVRYNIDAFVV